MTDPRTLLVLALAAAGVFFALVAAIGLIRMPDLYTRAHSSSKSDTLAGLFTLVAVGVAFGVDIATVKAFLLLVFIFITNPTAAHAIARAAAEQGIEPWTTEGEDG